MENIRGKYDIVENYLKCNANETDRNDVTWKWKR